MKEIDKMLNQWVHNSIIRRELRQLILDKINNKQTEAFKAGVAITRIHKR